MRFPCVLRDTAAGRRYTAYSHPQQRLVKSEQRFVDFVNIVVFLQNEKLQHNDLHGGQLLLTFSENKLDRIYLIDLAKMTQSDDCSSDNDGKFFLTLDKLLETKL